ncbi:peptidase S28 [Naegleria gruberi]|uniref:Peptidase S28 n=1 Tax=Naegleria gruberi TaxID=5762 RepID=D2V186_NAEGR|nr:peptidase S28 [Naegleria gruberi]EFC49265.1 peptidase S28 [Naegleria gruberi]|eukprot:XP_002682009.1 peptidase S28 [Naegleria gruberi]
MTQRLDHFDPQNTETFQQRFWVNDTMWQGKNVFIIIGGEGPASSKYLTGHFVINEYGKKHGALLAALEHRFYGESVPRKSLATDNLRYLTSEQALQDLVEFRSLLVKKYRMDEANVKFVCFGGSYSGNLSAWLKAKYPHLFVGAIASSGPVEAKLEFNEYMMTVANSIGPKCTDRVRKANDLIEQLIATPAGRQRVASMFNVCNPESMTNNDDIALLFSSLSDGVCEVVQYNLDNNGAQGFNVTSMCAIIESSDDALEGFANWVKTWNSYSQSSCTQNLYSDFIKQMQDVRPWPANENAAGRSWTYQTCVEFGYYQNAVGPKQPFSPRITLEWFVQQCSQIFGINGMKPDIDFTNNMYGSKNIQTTNTVFSTGSVDPWSVLAVAQPTRNIAQNYVYHMQGTAHCADLYSSSPKDLPTLTNTRVQTQKLLDQWLA